MVRLGNLHLLGVGVKRVLASLPDSAKHFYALTIFTDCPFSDDS